ncbi:MAG: hypothetical protein AB7Q97_23455 [Gammaproteobacteria bacterium]
MASLDKDKMMLDAMVEASHRARQNRHGRYAAAVGVASVLVLLIAGRPLLPFGIRVVLAIGGILGALLVLIYLSTKWFGRGTWDGPSWWVP